MRVPARPEELDVPWLRRALPRTDAFRDVRLRGVGMRRIGEGYGLDGVVLRLVLETEGAPGAAPPSLVAKLVKGPRGRAEVAFYERIAPCMPIRLPRCHAGLVSERGDRAVLLLEDLTHAEQGDAVAGADLEASRAVLGAMARFHAAFAGARHEALANLPIWRGEAAGLAAKVDDRMPRFLARYGERIDGAARGLLAGLAPRLPAAAAVLERSRPTLVHMDLHGDNVLFLPSGEPVILDWPHARRGPAALDVARFLVEGTHRDVRRRHEPDLLATYAHAREAAGAPLPSQERAMREHGAAVLWFLATAAAWGGAEDPGFETPRVREIVDTLVLSVTAAATAGLT